MKSYLTLRNLYGSWTNNTTTSNLTLADQMINDGTRKILSDRNDWPFLEATATFSTVASTQFYDLPYNVDKIKSVTVVNGNVRYTPVEISSRDEWDTLNLNTSVTSNIPEYYYIYAGQVGFWPTPSTSSLTATVSYKKGMKDLSVTDYTTGTISITTATTVVTGSGTTFTSAMVGRWLKTTDGYWYQITSFTSTTVIGLDKIYNGATIAGASYTIGEMSELPESYQDLPVYYAVSQYWQTNGEVARAREYKGLFDEGLLKLRLDWGNQSSNVEINGMRSVINPNLTLTL